MGIVRRLDDLRLEDPEGARIRAIANLERLRTARDKLRRATKKQRALTQLIQTDLGNR